MWRSPSSNICRINHLKIPDIPHPSSDCPMIFQYSLLYYYSLTISPYWVCLKIGYPVSLKFMVYRPCRHKQWHFLGATINIPWNQPLYSRIFPYHIWRFPKIGLPLNHHPFDFRIHYKFINHLLGGPFHISHDLSHDFPFSEPGRNLPGRACAGGASQLWAATAVPPSGGGQLCGALPQQRGRTFRQGMSSCNDFTMAGWFGRFFIFPYIGNNFHIFHIPTDELHHFSEG